MIRILAATILFAVMGTIPAKATLSLPIFRQCLCITPAGAWAVKPRGAKHKPCVIVCNATPQKRNIEITDVSSSRRRAHARPFRGAHVDTGERVRGRHLRGVHGSRAAASEVFDNDGRVRLVAGLAPRLTRSAAATHRAVRIAAQRTPVARDMPLREGMRIIRIPSSAVSSAGTSRPADCYGIQWCGCWLRHAFGIADRSLNQAIRWARMGAAASPDSANVVVWRHHVGKLLAHEGGRILVQSGNDGGAVRTRWLSPRVLGGVVAYRRV